MLDEIHDANAKLNYIKTRKDFNIQEFRFPSEIWIKPAAVESDVDSNYYIDHCKNAIQNYVL